MIGLRVKKIISELPEGIDLVAATKDRTAGQIKEAVAAGIRIIGENYLKQAKENYAAIGNKVKWHFIGHLQTNKARKAVQIFDMIETLDSLRLAQALDFECSRINKRMPVLVEVNSASEEQKYGLLPHEVMDFIKQLLNFSYLEPAGLMTMGPFTENVEEARPYLQKTKILFEKIKEKYGNQLNWRYLSMGMSATYKVAIEEGANIIRVGTAIFGPR